MEDTSSWRNSNCLLACKNLGWYSVIAILFSSIYISGLIAVDDGLPKCQGKM